ncbi:glycosyltransferase family 4 protein [Luteibacter yeojuensis]|nr:glycosyltransferase family 4 protein [Luteibacter yeojuensis]
METYAAKLTHALRVRCELEAAVLPGRSNGRPPRMWRVAIFLVASMGRVAFRHADVIHVGDLVLWPVAWVALKRDSAPTVVITAYGLDVVYGRRRGLLPALYAFYLRLAARAIGDSVRIIAISRHTAGLCRDAGFRDVVVVTLGVDPPGEPVPDNRAAPGHPFLLFAGRLVRRKGAAWFVREVMPLMPAGIRLVVVGAVWDSDELAGCLTDPRVDYRGTVGAGELKRLRRDAVAVVMPNIHSEGFDTEGFGLAAVEAGADGGVLVASGIEGLVDAVVDGVTGFLLPAGDSCAWAATLERLLSWKPGQREAFIRGCQTEIAHRFAWPAVAEHTMAAYAPRAVPT